MTSPRSHNQEVDLQDQSPFQDLDPLHREHFQRVCPFWNKADINKLIKQTAELKL